MAIDPFYWVAFAAFALPAAWLEFDHGSGLFGGGKGASSSRVGGPGGRGAEYARFRNNYLAVFALMMGVSQGRNDCLKRRGWAWRRCLWQLQAAPWLCPRLCRGTSTSGLPRPTFELDAKPPFTPM